eukprot:CAMPEP_0118879342 /NCGR_PEP_ID=MMETSP1163-20130328/19172_1 /TAXON_ID=124430 /ORGANISM="Phaeomonas parva, Strain CCMP2877" /LENGTH=123 /DNA_ID=CAMNT_0006815477 /DNA_START=290 /DNA_END=658 /DNA_ORIENTATION=-
MEMPLAAPAPAPGPGPAAYAAFSGLLRGARLNPPLEDFFKPEPTPKASFEPLRSALAGGGDDEEDDGGDVHHRPLDLSIGTLSALNSSEDFGAPPVAAADLPDPGLGPQLMPKPDERGGGGGG